MMSEQPMSAVLPWPEGVVARYLTVAGATVDMRQRGIATLATCTGCPFEVSSSSDGWVHGKAQDHAERCRALPRPESGR